MLMHNSEISVKIFIIILQAASGQSVLWCSKKETCNVFELNEIAHNFSFFLPRDNSIHSHIYFHIVNEFSCNRCAVKSDRRKMIKNFYSKSIFNISLNYWEQETLSIEGVHGFYLDQKEKEWHTQVIYGDHVVARLPYSNVEYQICNGKQLK